MTRQKLVEIAKSYILKRKTTPEEWVGTNTIHFPDFAGYRALVLVCRFDYRFVESLSSERWENWTPAILGFPNTSGAVSEDENLQNLLIAQAYQQAPEALIAVLRTLIDSESVDSDRLFILRRVEGCVDSPMCSELVPKLSDGSLNAACAGELARFLLTEHSQIFVCLNGET